MIPKRIWQTAESHALVPQARECAESWRTLNPEYAYSLVDAAEREALMAAHFDARTLAVYRALPLSVMRADLWRYGVLLAHGGVYADVDTVCVTPIDSWVTGDAVIGVENDTHFCLWAIAAAPQHPILAEVIARIVSLAWRHGIDTRNEHFVHAHTGPQIFTEAIAAVCGMPGANARAIRERFGAAGETQFQPYAFFQGQHVKHLYGSKYFGDGYPKWVEERERVEKRVIRVPGSE